MAVLCFSFVSVQVGRTVRGIQNGEIVVLGKCRLTVMYGIFNRRFDSGGEILVSQLLRGDVVEPQSHSKFYPRCLNVPFA
jgi:hypothetical protein